MKWALFFVQIALVATFSYEYIYWGEYSDIAVDDIWFGPIPPPRKCHQNMSKACRAVFA